VFKHLFVFIASFFLLLNTAYAQDALSPNAPPDHDGIALGAGFTPDPLPIAGILGGGNINVAPFNLGDRCQGYVTAQPDFRINIVFPFTFLRFIFVSDSLLNDTSLIIRSPGGTYRCNDDSFTVNNPSIDYRDLVMGEYNIWVGAVAPNTTPQGTLYITISEGIVPSSTGLIMPFGAPVVTPTPGGVALPTTVPGSFMDSSAAPMHGTTVLEHGFLPDPFWLPVVAGGVIPVPPHDLADSTNVDDTLCRGYASSPPQLRIQWRGLSTRLRMFFVPSIPADADSGLAVRAPSGWQCSSSFAPGFLDPQVEFINPSEGVYDIWVTHETTPALPVSGILYVTEKQFYPTFVPEIVSSTITNLNGLDPSQPAKQGGLAVSGILASEPVAVTLSGGGAVDLGAANPSLERRSGCLGYHDAVADYALMLESPQLYLRLFFVAADAAQDAVLVVRAPDGSWYCNDDSYDSVHPTLNLIGVPAGEYSLWLGNFDAPEAITGSLYLTQGDLSPLSFVLP
jgi:hypothetical protein